MIVFNCLGAVDEAFAYMGATVFFMHGFAVGSLRTHFRKKKGICGDMITDMVSGCFGYMGAIGQMEYEIQNERPVPTLKGEEENSGELEDTLIMSQEPVSTDDVLFCMCT